MNMKKTIAAVAAASVAVSAMATLATTASAVEYTYNLARQAVAKKSSGAKISTTFTNVALEANGYFVIKPMFDSTKAPRNDKDIVTIDGTYWDDAAANNKRFDTIFATVSTEVEGWKKETAALILQTDAQVTAAQTATGLTGLQKGDIVVPVKPVGSNATAAGLIASTKANITVTYTYAAADVSISKGIKEINNAISNNTIGIEAVTSGDKTNVTAGTVTAPATVAGYVGSGNASVDGTTGPIDVKNASATGTATYTTKNTANSVAFTVNNSVTGESLTPANFSATVDDTKALAWIQAAVTGNTGTATNTVTANADGTITLKIFNKGSNTAWDDNSAMAGLGITLPTIASGSAKDGEVTAVLTLGDYAWRDASKDEITGIVNKGSNKILPGTTVAITGTTTTGETWASGANERGGAVSAGDNASVQLRPYYTDSTTAYTATPYIADAVSNGTYRGYDDSNKDANILYYLRNQPVNPNASSDNYGKYDTAQGGYEVIKYGDYGNVTAVINDAVQNYDVVFRFNTAVQKIHENWDAGLGSDPREMVYDSWGYDYTMFGQQLYPLYGSDTWATKAELTNWAGIMGWGGTNLFSGALVVNGTFTMGLSVAENFDWLGNSISFAWDDVMDAAANANIDNPYALYIQSLSLITSTPWYWDSMTLELTEKSADDASADAGIGSDDETVPEFEDEEGDDAGETEEPEDDGEEPEDDDNGAANEVVSNPVTGNASVALAVIPVALAAAAVVAKKRG